MSPSLPSFPEPMMKIWPSSSLQAPTSDAFLGTVPLAPLPQPPRPQPPLPPFPPHPPRPAFACAIFSLPVFLDKRTRIFFASVLEEFVRLPEFVLVFTIVLIGSVRLNWCLGVTLFSYFRFLFVTRKNYGVKRQGNLLTKISLLHVSTSVCQYVSTPVCQ
jgi:hypothetical protein